MEKNSNEFNEAVRRVFAKLTPDELSLLAKYFTNINEETKCRKSFSPEEDFKLKQLVAKYGQDNWTAIEKEMPGRNSRQCRERYRHYLSPNISHRPWTEEEDKMLLRMVNEVGSKWVKISKFFENRSDISIKNRWVVLMRRNAGLTSDDKEKPQPVKKEEYQQPTFNGILPPLKLSPTNSSPIIVCHMPPMPIQIN